MSASESTQGARKYMMIAVLGTGGGVALMAFILYVGAMVQGSEKLRTQLANSYTDQYVRSIDQSFAAAQRQVDSLATTPGLAKLLNNKNLPELARLEPLLIRGIPDASRLRLLPTSDLNVQQTDRPDLSFADLDMIRQARDGLSVPGELRASGDVLQLHMIRAVHDGPGGPIRGVVLLSLDAKVLTNPLQAFPAGAGTMRLLQKFSEQDDENEMFTHGSEADRSARPMSLDTTNPLWSVSFRPSQRLLKHEVLTSGLMGTALGLGGLVCLLASLAAIFLQARAAPAPAPAEAKAKAPSPTRRRAMVSGAGPATANEEPPPMPEKQAAASPPSPPPEVDPLNAGQMLVEEDAQEDEEDLSGALDDLAAQEAAASSAPSAPSAPIDVPAEIFRAYDIRGIYGETLNEDIARAVGQAIGSAGAELSDGFFVVGHDVRNSSPALSEALIAGLVASGRQVLNIGKTATPVLYFAAQAEGVAGGVMVTGSHNPGQYNGFKVVLGGAALANDEITALRQRILEGNLLSGEGGVGEQDVNPSYLSQITEDISLSRPLKIVIDSGNGSAGLLAPQLYQDLGCEVTALFSEPDGNFPNHHPDPGNPDNLKELIARVKAEQADIGLAFDGDADRLGVVTGDGTIIYPDRLLMLFAKDVVSRNPGASVIYDVKCTRHLGRLISNYGGRPIMWKTGHSLIKAKIRETGALLVGEMSGHLFFGERWFGFDDALYAGARLLEILSREDRSAELIFAAFPSSFSTPEINLPVTEQTKFGLIDRMLKEGEFTGGKITNIDGVRVDFANGWGLVRASNTTPNLVLRFEGNTEEDLQSIKEIFRTQLQKLDSSLTLPS